MGLLLELGEERNVVDSNDEVECSWVVGSDWCREDVEEDVLLRVGCVATAVVVRDGGLSNELLDAELAALGLGNEMAVQEAVELRHAVELLGLKKMGDVAECGVRVGLVGDENAPDTRVDVGLTVENWKDGDLG